MTLPMLRPTWAEIDLSAYGRNLQKIRTKIGAEVKILALLKANAYGHGALDLGLYAQEKGLCEFFGVASAEEGVFLRQNGITLPILILGSLYPFEAFEYAIDYDLSITIASLSAAKAIKEIARKKNKKARCHVKQDSGMGRIGTRRSRVMAVLEELENDPFVQLEGLFTHLSSVDTDPAYTEEQVGYFRDTMTNVRQQKIPVNLCHMAASSAIESRADCYCDMVRAGHASFGLTEGYEPILSFKSRIVFEKEVSAGSSVSYNRSFVAPCSMKIATIPVGYGDGYLRSLSGKAEVLINGKRCAVLGNITMDMCMVDISQVEAHVGDEVVLIGKQGADEISAAELARKAGTIDYEITTLLTARVPRVYKRL
ncbi:MAG: alanine racemase [Elusimicrobiaceae bacterium]|nr:alanine racemase [Elusimicrobiaceae bacterium]